MKFESLLKKITNSTENPSTSFIKGIIPYNNFKNKNSLSADGNIIIAVDNDKTYIANKKGRIGYLVFLNENENADANKDQPVGANDTPLYKTYFINILPYSEPSYVINLSEHVDSPENFMIYLKSRLTYAKKNNTGKTEYYQPHLGKPEELPENHIFPYGDINKFEYTLIENINYSSYNAGLLKCATKDYPLLKDFIYKKFKFWKEDLVKEQISWNDIRDCPPPPGKTGGKRTRKSNRRVRKTHRINKKLKRPNAKNNKSSVSR